MKKIDIHIHPKFPAENVGGIIAHMDRYEIEKIFALGSITSEEVNENILRLRRLAPDRIVGAPYIDPRASDAFDKLQRYYDAGCRVVKLFPNYGYYPDDPAVLPFFEKVASLHCGVLSHCGWLGVKEVCATKYARPSHFEELFRRFPEIPFIMAHMGGIDGFIEGIMYTTRTPNVYLDTTPGQSYWVFKYAPDFVKGMPPERLLLGSDGVSPETDDSTYKTISGHLSALGWEARLNDIFYRNADNLIKQYHLIPD